jgi:hypothetical protein
MDFQLTGMEPGDTLLSLILKTYESIEQRNSLPLS